MRVLASTQRRDLITSASALPHCMRVLEEETDTETDRQRQRQKREKQAGTQKRSK